MEWCRSSRCDTSACVEVRRQRISDGDDLTDVEVRWSVNPDRVLAFTEDEWRAFIEGVKNGEFDV
jgi:hypothetical protein